MGRLTEQGVSIIMVSSDMPELISMSDRVIVFSNGRISQELKKGEIRSISGRGFLTIGHIIIG